MKVMGKKNIANLYDPPKSRTQFSEGQKSKGILDDYAVRGDIATKEGSIQKVPVNEDDIVNKKFLDDNYYDGSEFTAGSILFSDGTNIVEDNFNLYWDSATHELQPHHMKIVSDGTQASPALKFNDTNTGFYKSGDSVRFSLNNSTKMTIDGTGLGIGTVSPHVQFEIASTDPGGTLALHSTAGVINDSDEIGQLLFTGDDTAYRVGAKIVGDATAVWGSNTNDAPTALYFYTQDDGDTSSLGTPRMVINSNGNVGIGTATPDTTLHLHEASSGANFLKITNTTTGEGATDGMLFGMGADETLQIWQYENLDMLFGTNNIERMRLDNNGALFFTRDGTGLPYGSCYGNDIAWTQVAALNVVYNVSDADMVTGQLNLATHDGNGKLTVTKAGRYHCHYTATIKSSVAGKHIISGFEISGSGNMEPAGRNHIDLVGAGNQLECSGNAILDLAAGATIEMAISSSDAGNPTVTVEHLNITCVQIGGT